MPSQPPGAKAASLTLHPDPQLKALGSLSVGDRLQVRVIRSLPSGEVEIRLRGRTLIARNAGGLSIGESAQVRVSSLEPSVVLKKIPAESKPSPGVKGGFVPAVSVAPTFMEQITALYQDPFLKVETDGELPGLLRKIGEALACFLDPADISEKGLESLFTLLGGEREDILGRVLDRLDTSSLPRLIGRVADSAPEAWTPLLMEGHEPLAVEELLERLGTLKKGIELSRVANALLWRSETTVFLEWPPLAPESGPLRILIRQEEKEVSGAQQGAGKGFSVRMHLDLSNLGELRADLFFATKIDLTIRASKDACGFLEGFREGFSRALETFDKPVRLTIAPLSEEDPPFPDLPTLLAKAKGEAGQLHVTA